MFIGWFSTNNTFYSAMKFKMAAMAGLNLTKVFFVENHPMNIHVQFGFNHICSF
jgi:hypothetical protein